MSDWRYLRLASLHDACFHLISATVAMEFDGLHSAARCAQRRGLIAPHTVKAMMRLDHAFHVCRHLTAAKAAGILHRLRAELTANGADSPQPNAPSDDSSPSSQVHRMQAASAATEMHDAQPASAPTVETAEMHYAQPASASTAAETAAVQGVQPVPSLGGPPWSRTACSQCQAPLGPPWSRMASSSQRCCRGLPQL